LREPFSYCSLLIVLRIPGSFRFPRLASALAVRRRTNLLAPHKRNSSLAGRTP